MSAPGSTTKAALSLLLTSFLLTPAPMFAASKKPQYLPPMAPEVDPSANRAASRPAVNDYSAPAPANDYTADSSDQGDSKADRTKDLLQQALLKHNQGDMNGAERLFKQVLAIDPRNSDANFNLGAMAEDRGDLNGALRYYQTASRVSPSDSDVRDAIASVQNKMRQQQVAQQEAQAIQKKDALRPIAQDAAAAYKAGRYDQAIGDLQRVLSQSPNDPSALFGLGQAYRGKGDKVHAREYLSRAVQASPDNQLYRATLADLNTDMQRGGGSGQNRQPQLADGPQPAPDYRGGGRGGSRGGYGQNDYSGDNQGLQPYSGNSPEIASESPDSQAGQLTPFTSQGEAPLYGHALANGSGMRMGGGGMGMGLGSALGMGMLGMGLGRMGGGSMYYPGRGTRLVRGAVVGSLAGAAIGALTNMHSYGGPRAGAMRGALTGGIMGLITGF